MKKIIIFDLDGTLAASKSPMSSEMLFLLWDLTMAYKVGIISGAAWEQFDT